MVKVLVTNALTGLGLPTVKVVFTLEGVLKLKKITTNGGGISIKTLEEGVYSVTLSKIGYITQTLSVNITNDKLNRIQAALVKGWCYFNGSTTLSRATLTTNEAKMARERFTSIAFEASIG